MAISVDSLAALALLAAAISSWVFSIGFRSGARLNLRFAAVMLAAVAIASWSRESGLVFAVSWFAASLAGTALALAFLGGAPVWLSSFAFAGAFALGLGGALGQSWAGFAVQAGAALALLGTSFSQLRKDPRASFLGGLGALSLLFADLALMDNRTDSALFFFAAALLLSTRALKNPVVELEPAGDVLIGRNRA